MIGKENFTFLHDRARRKAMNCRNKASTLVNAKLFRERHKTHEATGKPAVPIGQPAGDGMGSTDVEVEVGHKSWDEVAGATETTGDMLPKTYSQVPQGQTSSSA